MGQVGTGGPGGKGIRAGEEVLLSFALEATSQVNARCLRMLNQLAGQDSPGLPPAMAACSRQFRELTPLAIDVAARQPFLLVDFAFGNPRLFHTLLDSASAGRASSQTSTALPRAEAVALALGSLLLAQSVCRHHPAHARLLLGLDPSLQDCLAQLHLPDLERLAETHPHPVRIRWEERPDVWKHLLNAAASTDQDAPMRFRMYGIQLMAGDLGRTS